MTDTPHNWHWRDGPVEPGRAIIFDVDGVLADATGRQHLLEGYADWDEFFAECGSDGLIEDVAALMPLLDPSLVVVLLTARPIWVQDRTLAWIDRHDLRWDVLIMRDHHDWMPSPRFKAKEILELELRGFDVELAIDDDMRNVEAFKAGGLPCIYIHSGYHPH